MSNPGGNGDQREFRCEHCNGKILIPANLPATTGPCPHCQKTITSPGADLPPDLDPIFGRPIKSDPVPPPPPVPTGPDPAELEAKRKAEAQRIAAESAAAEEQVRKAAAEKAEAERKAAAEKAEQERKAAAEKAEQERKAAAEREIQERKAAAEKAEAARLAEAQAAEEAELARKAAQAKAEQEAARERERKEAEAAKEREVAAAALAAAAQVKAAAEKAESERLAAQAAAERENAEKLAAEKAAHESRLAEAKAAEAKAAEAKTAEAKAAEAKAAEAKAAEAKAAEAKAAEAKAAEAKAAEAKAAEAKVAEARAAEARAAEARAAEVKAAEAKATEDAKKSQEAAAQASSLPAAAPAPVPAPSAPAERVDSVEPKASEPVSPVAPQNPLEATEEKLEDIEALAPKKEQKAKKKFPVLPVAAMLVLMAIAGAAILFIPKLMRDPTDPIVVDPASAAAQKEIEYLKTGWEVDARRILGEFLAAEIAEGKAANSIRGAELLGQMKAYYGEGKIDDSDTPESAFSVYPLEMDDKKRGIFMLSYDRPPAYELSEFFTPLAPLDVKFKLREPDMLLASVGRSNNFTAESLQVHALFKRSDAGLKLDWETFVQTKYRTLRDFLELPVAGNKGVFRVIVSETVPEKRNGPAGHRTYLISDPAHRAEDSARVFVAGDSEIGRAFSILNWRGTKEARVVSKTATLELSWSDESTPQLSVSRFICWEFLGVGGEAIEQ